jgi:hypothetical protein
MHAIVRLYVDRRAVLQWHLFEELPQAVQLGRGLLGTDPHLLRYRLGVAAGAASCLSPGPELHGCTDLQFVLGLPFVRLLRRVQHDGDLLGQPCLFELFVLRVQLLVPRLQPG